MVSLWAAHLALLAALSSASVSPDPVCGGHTLCDVADSLGRGDSGRRALISGLGNRADPQRRRLSAWALGMAPSLSDDATAALIQALGDDDAEVRASAVISLARGGRPTASKLLAALETADASTRRRIAEAIGRIGSKAPAELEGALYSAYPEVRSAAALAADRVPHNLSPALEEEIERSLRNRDQDVVEQALERVRQWPVDSPGTRAEVVALSGSSTSDVRIAAFRAMARLTPVPAIESAVVAGLADADEAVRTEAAEAAAAHPTLLSPEVASRVCRLLGNSGDVYTAQAALKNAWMRQPRLAAECLAEAPALRSLLPMFVSIGTEAASHLAAFSRDHSRSEEARLRALDALGEVLGTSEKGLDVQQLSLGDDAYQEVTNVPMARISSTVAAAVRDCAGDSNPTIRARAVRLLVDLPFRDDASLTIVRNAMLDRDDTCRRTALSALDHGDAETVERFFDVAFGTDSALAAPALETFVDLLRRYRLDRPSFSFAPTMERVRRLREAAISSDRRKAMVAAQLLSLVGSIDPGVAAEVATWVRGSRQQRMISLATVAFRPGRYTLEDESNIVASLRDREPFVRRWASYALMRGVLEGRTRPRLHSVTGAAADPDANVRMTVVQVLWILAKDDPEAEKALLRLARARHKEARALALFFLGRLEPPPEAARDILLAGVDSSTRAVALSAVSGLGRMRPEIGTVRVLARMLATPQDRDVRDAVIEALRKFGPAAVEVVPALLDVVDSEPREDHSRMLKAIEAMGPEAWGEVKARLPMTRTADLVRRMQYQNLFSERDVPLLVKVLESGDWGVGAAAVEALVALGTAAAPGLILSLDSSTQAVRFGAAMALGRVGMGDVRAAGVLAGAVGSPRYEESALHALQTFGGHAACALPAAFDLLISTRGWIFVGGVSRLAVAVDPDSLAAKASLLYGLDRHPWSAISVWARLNRPAKEWLDRYVHEDSLLLALRNTNESGREESIAALRTIGTSKALAAISAWEQER